MSEEPFPIYFNVKEVRDYLTTFGYVYTIRKKSRPVGYTIAIFKDEDDGLTEIGDVCVMAVTRTLNSYEKLLPYVGESGLTWNPDHQVESLYYAMGYSLEDCKKICLSQMWLTLAQKLSGKNLGLFKVELVTQPLNTS